MKTIATLVGVAALLLTTGCATTLGTNQTLQTTDGKVLPKVDHINLSSDGSAVVCYDPANTVCEFVPTNKVSKK